MLPTQVAAACRSASQQVHTQHWPQVTCYGPCIAFRKEQGVTQALKGQEGGGQEGGAGSMVNAKHLMVDLHVS